MADAPHCQTSYFAQSAYHVRGSASRSAIYATAVWPHDVTRRDPAVSRAIFRPELRVFFFFFNSFAYIARQDNNLLQTADGTFQTRFPLPATCGAENYGLFPFLLHFLGLPRFRVPVFQTRRGNVSQGFARTQPIYIEAGRPGGLVGILINEPSGRQVMGSSSGDSDYYEFFSLAFVLASG